MLVRLIDQDDPSEEYLNSASYNGSNLFMKEMKLYRVAHLVAGHSLLTSKSVAGLTA